MISKAPTPPRADLVRLREQGYSRKKIAEFYGVSLARVKRWIREMDVPASTNKFTSDKIAAPSPVNLGTDYGLTLIDRAKQKLGERVSQDYRGYLLDGRLVRVDILISAAGLKVPQIP